MGRMSTHSLGVQCAKCKEQLAPDNCCVPGHGSSFQEPNAWAARIWPDHPCFAGITPEPGPL